MLILEGCEMKRMWPILKLQTNICLQRLKLVSVNGTLANIRTQTFRIRIKIANNFTETFCGSIPCHIPSRHLLNDNCSLI